MSFWPTFIGILVAAVLLTIAYKVFWAKLSQQFSRSGQDTLPVHQPRPVSQPPPRPPPPSQSYQSSPYTPPVRQPEQHQPVYRPPPPAAAPPAFPVRPPLPSQNYQSSPYTPPVHQPEQHQPVYRPPPPAAAPPAFPVRPPLPSQSYQSSPYTPPVHQPEQHQPVSQPPPHRPPPSQSYGSSPHTTPPSPHEPPKYEDVNQKDQPNEYYLGLRARANKEGDEMARCFDERHKANSRGDRAAAKVLSKQGKNHKQEMEQLNKEASDWIYLENNRDRKPGEIDLHGLYVKEAIARTDTALEEAKLRGDSEIRLIVGKGLHSEGGTAKVRPAIQELMRKYQLVAEFDPSNSGVLVVKLNGLTPIRHRRHLNISHRHGRRRASNIGT